ncbi:ribosomal large subunit pseudouridine synthase B [Fibrella aestuarina BUZ 2]|uniref:Pseudouridine synthase n=1 Tax=Fibrella aestuarina BUZ 2 TaxID=1166018 RepID=I0KCL8_9BACT|nr:pseudouridine synthase [Fibrella aestuarina]CCH01871.1 ribosomal large subunit pseudouridine synthase B [Fibrella aestuarina BUZ 2]
MKRNQDNNDRFERRDGEGRSDGRRDDARPFARNNQSGERRDAGRREGGSDRPRFNRDDRSSGGDRPRSFDRDRNAGSDRPRSFDRDRNRDERPSGDRPRSFDRNRSDRPSGDRPYKPFNRDDRAERPRSFDRDRDDRSSGGDRPRSFDRDRTAGDDRPERPRSFDRDRTAGSDRPRFNRDDRPERPRSFDRDDNRSEGRRSFDRDGGSDRPRKPFNRDERPSGGDRPRSFDRDRNAGGDRPRSFDRDRNRDERPSGDRPRSFDRNRDERPADDRPRSFDRDRSDRQSGDRPRSFDRDRSAGGDRSERPRSFDRDRNTGSDRPRSFDRDRNRDDRSERPRSFDRDRNSEESGEPHFDRRTGRYNKAPNYNLDVMKKNLPRTKKVAQNLKRESDPDSIRLNRYIANAGVCSRREADELIGKGDVQVNGKVITEMGYRVKPGDVVKYGNKVLNPEKMVYVLLNKPKDVITTTDDPEERNTVMDLVADAGPFRLYPVGRLDRNTTGLLLMTNDGELAGKLTHPSNNVKKVYQVELDKPISEEHFEAIRNGLELEDGFIKPDDLAIVTPDAQVVGVEIHSGRNRIVRRMFESQGYEVTKLDRTVFAGLTKKELPRGKWRFLEPKEVVKLKYLM